VNKKKQTNKLLGIFIYLKQTLLTNIQALFVVPVFLFVITGFVLSILTPGLYTRGNETLNPKASAAQNNTINFQARLLTNTGALVPDGNYHIEFKLYDSLAGGSSAQGVCSTNSSTDDCWWRETRTTGNLVAVKNGYISVSLGSVTPFGASLPWDQELWLTMNIGGNSGSASWNGEMSPRMRITSLPFAQAAAKLKGTNGLYDADQLVQLGPGSVQTISSTGAAVRINQTGTGALLQIQGAGSDKMTLAANGDISVAGTGVFQGSSVTIGTSSQAGVLTLSDGSSNTTTIQAASTTGNLTFTLPNAYGGSGDCIVGNGSGGLSFSSTCGAGGSGSAPTTATYLTLSNDATLTAERVLTAGTNISVSDGGANSTLTINVSNSPTFSGTVTVQGATLTIGTTSQAGSLVLNDGSNNTTTLQSAAIAGNLSFTLPSGYGSNGNCLIGDGAGGISFSSTCGSGGSGTAPVGASYLTLGLDGTLTNERVLTAGSNISITDGGANGNLTVNVVSNPSFTGGATIRGLTVDTATATDDRLLLSVTTGGAGRFDGTITSADLTAARTYTLPDATGTFITTGNLSAITATGTITSGTWQGSVIADTYINDTLTIGSGSSVDWTALNNYPAACGAGTAVTALGDTITCTAFAASSGSANYIQAQGTTPGTAQNTNFNIGTGTGIAAVFNATSSILLNGANINTGGTLSNVAYKDQANSFSAANTFTAANAITLGTTGSNNGGVVFRSSNAGSSTVTLQALTTLGATARTITLPDATGTVAVSASGALSLSATTGALTVADAVANGSTKGVASFTAADFNDSAGNISIDYTNGQAASGSTKGFLTAADWTTFNGKLAAEADTLQSVTTRGATTTTASSFTGGATIRGLTVDTATATDDRLLLSVTTGGAGRFDGTITSADLTAARTYTLPDATGTFITTGNLSAITATGTITSGTWQGSVIADTYINDTLTIGSGSSVDWTALNNYPAACGAGTAVTALGDTITCTAFAASSGSANYIQAQGTTPGTAQNTNFNIGTGTGIAAVFNATSSILLNGANINTGGTLSNVAYKDQANSFSAANTFTAANAITLGTTGSNNGGVVFRSSNAGSSTVTLQALTTLGATARTITLPDATGTVAVSASGALSLSATTGALTVADAVANGSTKGVASFTAADFNDSAGNISIDYTNGQAASGSTKGFLTAADWTTFNGKLAAEADTLQSVTTRGATTTTASSFTGGATIRGLTVDTATATDDLLVLSVTTGGAGRFTGTITSTDLTANRSYTLPNAGGTFAVSASTPLTLNATTGNLTITDAAANGSTKGAASFTAADFNDSAGNISLDYANGQAASGSAKGFLTSADWTTFNGKLSAEADTLQSVIARGATATSAASFTGGATIRGLTVETATATQDQIILQAAGVGAARFTGTITNADLTAARTYTLPDASGTLCTTATCLTSFSEADTLQSVTTRGATTTTASSFTGGATIRGLTVETATATDDLLVLSVTTGGAGRFTGTITSTDLTANRSYTLPNAGGTFAVSASTPLTLNATTGNLTITDAAANGSTKGAASFTAADFNDSAGNISLDYANGQAASGSAKGFLTSADWTTFNGKLSAEADTLQSVIARGATATSAASFTGGATIRGLTVETATATQDQIILQAAGVGAARFTGTITNADLTAARTYTLPDASGTLCTTATCLTSFSEADTLQSVTTRGATTTTASTFSGGLTASGGLNATGAGTGLSVTNNATIGGTLAVTSTVTGGTYNGQTISSTANFTGTLGVTGATTLTGALTVNNTAYVRNLTTGTATATDDQLILSVTAGGAARFNGTITSADLTANQTYTLPNATGTLCLTSTCLTAEADTLQSVIGRGATATSAATFNGGATIRGATVDNATATDDRILITSAALGTGTRFDGTITNANLTAARTYTLQDNSGIIPLATAANSLFFTTSGATNLTLPTTGTVCTTATCLTSFSEADTLQSVTTRGATTTTASTFSGGLTASGGLNATGAGTGLSVTNNATIGGTLAVTSTVTGGTYNGQTISSTANFTGTLGVTGATTLTGALTVNNTAYVRNLTTGTATATDDQLILSVTAGGAARFNGTITSADLTANQTYTLPNATGTLCLTSTCLTAEADTLQSVIGRGATATSAATFNGGATIRGATVDNATATDDRILITSAALGTGTRFDGTITNANLTAARTYTLQDNSGIIPLATAANSLFFTTSGATNLTLPTTGTVCTTATCLTSFSEADTLQSVTTRGATTTTASTFSGGLTASGGLNATGAGTGLSVTNNATIGGTLAVTSTVTGGTYNGQTISSTANFTGTLGVTGATTLTGALTVNNTAYVRNLTTGTATATDDQLILSVTAGGAARFNGTITSADLTANQTYTLPNATGTLCLTSTCLTAEADTLQSVIGRGATATSAATFNGGATIRGATVDNATATDDRILITSAALGTGTRFDGTITNANLTAARTYTLQDNSGIIPLATAANSLFFTTSGATNLTLPTTGTVCTTATCLTSFSEADTLQSVTTRGATTTTASTFSGGLTASGGLNATGAGTGLSVTNNATIGGTLAVTSTVTGGTYNGQTISSTANFTGTLGVTGATTLTGALTVNNTAYVRNLTTGTATATDDQLILSVTAGGAARFNGTITSADLTANQTYTLPNATGTLCLTSTCLTAEADTLQSVIGRGATATSAATFNGGATIRGLTVDTATVTQDQIVLQAAAVGAARFVGTITNADLTAARTYTLPDASGTLCTTATCLTSFSEADTLQSVTTRGATTTTASSFTGGATIRGLTVDTATATDDLLVLSVTTGGAGRFTGTITSTDLTANRSYTLPNAGGTFAVSASTPLTLNATTGNLTITDAAANGSTKGAASFATNDFDATSGNISIDYTNGQAASGSAKGFLTSADWTTFNGKLSAEADTLQSVIGRGATATSAATFNGGATIRGLTVDNATANDDRILITSAALGSGTRFDGTITNANLTAARTYTLQDNSGIIPLATAANSLFFTTSGATSLTLPTTGTVCTTATCLTSFSEADTLQSVTTRGATTTTASSFTGGATIRGLTVDTATATDDLLVLSVTAGGAGRFTGTITSTDLTANRSYTLPNAGGTFAVSASTPLTLNATTGNLTITDAAANGSTKGAASFATNDFDATSGNISIDYTNGQAASGSAKGFLTSADWTTFNGKLSAEADTLQSVIGRGATATSAATFNGGATIRGLTVDNATANDDRILITSAALGSGTRFDGTITNANLTAARTYTLQDNSGIIPLATAANSLFFTTSGATSLTLPTTGTVCTTATCLTSFSEADTLQSVTTRGATTTTASSFTGGATIRGLTVDTATATDDLLVLSVTAGGAGRFTGTITSTDLTANRTYTLPNETGTICTTGSVCSGYQASLGYTAANVSLSNLSSVNINTALNATAGNLALQTTTSGNITLTTAVAGGLVNILTGNLKVGSGTPGLTLNGDDAYITGTLEADGNADLGGTLTLGADVVLSRGAANRLDLASGDSLNLVSGSIQQNTTTRLTSAGLFQAADGAIGGPAYAFSGDLTTGMYRIGASQIGFSAGGTKRFEVTTTGAQVTGALTVTSGLTQGSAAGVGQFTNNGSTLNTALALGDLAAGAIGANTATVDIYTSFTIAPTAAGRNYTLPSPTSASAGRIIYISNIHATNSFTVTAGTAFTIAPGGTGSFVWNGSAWTLVGNVGGSGNFIQNQNAAAQSSSNFWISATGRADTSFVAPLYASTGTGSLTVNAAGANTLLLQTNATTRFTVDAAASTLTGNGATNIRGGTSLNIGSTGANDVTIGTNGTTRFTVNNAASTITGNAATSILGGTTLNLGSTGANALTLATNATTRFTLSASASTLTGNGATTITGGTSLALNSTGANAVTLDTGGAAGITIGGTNANAVSIGNNASSASILSNGSLNIGNNAVNKTINIGITGSTANTTTINMATSTGAAQTVNIGSTNTTSATNIYGGTGNINLLTNSASASVIVKSQTNAINAFQVQNAAGKTYLDVDTLANNNLITNGDIESGVTGFTAKGATTRTQTNTYFWEGANSLSVATTAAANDGIKYDYVFSPNTIYSFSFYARTASGTFTDFVIGRQDNGADIDTNCINSILSITTTWTRYRCSFQTGGTISGSNVYIKKTGTSAETIYIDGVQLEAGAVVSGFNEVKLGVGTSAPQTALDVMGRIRIGEDSTTTAQNGDLIIQKNNANGGVVTALYNTATNTESLSAFKAYSNNGATEMQMVSDGLGTLTGTASSGALRTYSNSSILMMPNGTESASFAANGDVTLGMPTYYSTGTASQTGTTITGSGTTWTSAMVGMKMVFNNKVVANITGFTNATTLTTDISRTVSSQTYKIVTPAMSIANTGVVTVKSASNSTSAFRVQDSNTANILNVDTTNVSVSVGSSTTAKIFADKVDYSTGSDPWYVTSADLDKDGDVDLAATNLSSTTVSIFMNNGNGTFAAKVDYATGLEPRSVVAADLDKDGDLDLTIANYNATSVSVLMNNGAGTFAAKVDYTVGTNPGIATVVDLDKDGDLDIAAANVGSATVSILKNNGNGTFAAKVDYGTATWPINVSAADLDKDGDIDLVVPNYGSDSFSVLMNSGTGTFAAKVDYTTGTSPRAVAVNDYDKDGDIDVVIGNEVGDSISYFANNGSGVFAAKVDYLVNDVPRELITADFDKDGDSDVIISNYGSSNVSLLENNGNGTFATKVDYTVGSAAWGLTTADFDKDGDYDVAVANGGPDSVSVLINKTLAVSPTASPTLNVYSNGVSDSLRVQGSNDTNLLRVDGQGNTTIGSSAGTTNGLFSTRKDSSTGSGPYGQVAADFDKDGDEDLAIIRSTDKILLKFNDGKGSFSGTTEYTAGTMLAAIEAADFDKDGDMDIAVVNRTSDNISILLNTGSGAFGAATNYTAGTEPYSMTIGDVDKDGDIDIAVGDRTDATNNISVYKNNGNGTFAARTTFTGQDGVIGLKLADLDKDGDLDIASSDQFGGPYYLSILLNNGTGTFGTKTDYSANGSEDMEIVDVDKDGDNDVILAKAYGIQVFKNNGNGTFASVATYDQSQLQVYYLSSGDYDKDGDIDISVSVTGANALTYFANNGDGTFSTNVTYFSVGSLPDQVVSADFDKDGDLDLSVVNESSNSISVLFNSINNPNRLTVMDSAGTNAVMTVSNTSVGIGTASPNYTFHVKTGDSVGAFESTGTQAYLALLTSEGVNNRVEIVNRSGGRFAVWTLNGGDSFNVINNGNVGIGITNPTYKFQVNGQPAANGYTAFTNYSDARLKTNVNYLGDGYLDKIMQLKPSSFNYNELSGYDEATRNRLINGFIAQELQGVFPEMVGSTVINGVEYLDTNLSALPIFMVRAMQEQQVQINDAKTRLTALENSIQPSSNNMLDLTNGGTIQGSLNVIGNLNVTGSVAMSNLTVTGDTNIGNLTVNGNAVFNGNLTVQNISVANITINGHVITAGNAPTTIIGTAAGVEDQQNNIPAPQVTINGNDTAGTITIVAGANTADGELAKVTFNNPFGAKPRIVFSPANRDSSKVGAYYDSSLTTNNSFSLMADQAPQSGKTYTFTYWIAQ
jgi:hypothetical protein